MVKRNYIVASVIIILILISVFIFINQKSKIFDGNIVENDKQFSLDYLFFNKTITHKMNIKKDMYIGIRIINTVGNIDVVITDNNNNEIYRGNKISEDSNFFVKVGDTGEYTINVKGTKAKGSVSFDILEFYN